MSVEALLGVSELRVHFRDRLARRRLLLRGIDFEIHDSETFAVVGETGSGKSVLLRAMTRLAPGLRVSGKVHLRGHSKNILKARCGRLQKLRGGQMSYLAGGRGHVLHPLRTVGEQMREVLNCHRPEVKDEKEEIIYWLSKVGLPDPEASLRAMPGDLDLLSSARVGMAIGFSTFPRLLVADEPTAGLDQSNQELLLGILSGLLEQTGTAMLLGTRDFRVACRLADRVAVMERGAIVETGSLESVLTAPEHRLTKELLEVTPGIGLR